MIGACHAYVTAEIPHHVGDSHIVGRDDDLSHARRGFRTRVNVFDHRTAVDEREHLAGKARRSKSGGDESDDVKGADRIDSRISRVRVHDES